jgi:hypothetical protein
MEAPKTPNKAPLAPTDNDFGKMHKENEVAGTADAK